MLPKATPQGFFQKPVTVRPAKVHAVTEPAVKLAVAHVTPSQPEKPSPPAPTGKYELMNLAGIPPEDYGAADYIIFHESSWNPDATEPTTGAHGLPQALPYSKTGCGWDDAVCQLRWANEYAIDRYGGWWQAYNYWVANHNW